MREGQGKKKLADADRSALPFELLRMLLVSQVPVVASCMRQACLRVLLPLFEEVGIDGA